MEKQILYNMLNQDGYVEIESKYLSFFTQKFKDMYYVISRLESDGKKVNKDNVEIYSMLLGVPVDLGYAENDYPFTVKTSTLIDNLIDVKERELDIDRLKRLLEDYKTSGDAKTLEYVKKELEKKSKSKSYVNVIEFKDISSYLEDEINRIKNNIPLDGVYIYRSGFKSQQFMKLSNKLKIIEPTDLIVLAGRPSVGKSSFALALTHSLVKNGYKAFVFSLEMSNQQLLKRMAHAKSGVSNSKLMDITKTISDEDVNAYKEALRELEKLPILMIDKPPKSWLEMKEILIRNIDNYDFVVIDHLNVMGSYDGKDGNSTRIEVVTNITRDMKLFCLEYRKPIILLSQFNRGVGQGTKKDDRYAEPFMRDLRDSGSIEQDADKILILYRHEISNKIERETYEKYGMYKIVCKVEKNRAGSTGKIIYEFNGALQRWKEEQTNEDTNNG